MTVPSVPTVPAPATARKPQFDPTRAAYRRSRDAEAWVKGYVDKMCKWPAPKFVRAKE